MGNDTVIIESTEIPLLKHIYDWSVLGILLMIMFAMGCHIRLQELWNHLKKPWSVIVGMISQFVILPFTSFALMHAVNLKGLFAVGMLITSCCPSGTTSNIFTYYCDGDVPLSIAMTIISTILAVGMMPFNMWLYGRSLESEIVTIPYMKIVTSLIYITLPTAAGMVVLWKFPKVAPYITKIGSLMGILMICVTTIMGYMLFPNIFDKAPSILFVTVFALPLLGMLAGFVFAVCTRREGPARRTITIESGVQNISTAITVVTLSFTFEEQQEALLFPWLYSYAMIILCVVLCTMYRIQLRFFGTKDTLDSCESQQTIATKDVEYAEQGITNQGYISEKNSALSGAKL